MRWKAGEEVPVDEETEAATDARSERHDRSDRASHSTQSPLTHTSFSQPSCTGSPFLPDLHVTGHFSFLKIRVLIHVLIDSRCSRE